jgi:predicted HTH domain antitoxin
MASTEEEIDSLIRARSYASKEELISDAIRALLVQKPELKIEIATDLYKNGKVSLWKAADIAGIGQEEFKEHLAKRSVDMDPGARERPLKETVRVPSEEERMNILERYVGIIKLKSPLTLEEILDLEEDTWRS